MKDTRPIEAQVADLTEQQKKTVCNIFTYGLIGECIVLIPGVALMFFCLFLMFVDPVTFFETTINGMSLNHIFFLVCGVVAVLCFAFIAFIKIKFPYYSDKKAVYLRKQRKGK